MRKISKEIYLDQISDPTLYVVANRTDAVLYIDGLHKNFHFVDRLKNKKGARFESELVTDKPGSSASSASNGTIRHGLDRHFTHHEETARKFARRIAAKLASARRANRFRDLVLVAEPHFLGLLRSELDAETREAVKFEIAHEYAQGSDTAIRERIFRAIGSGG